MRIENLDTEKRNPNSLQIDRVSTAEMLRIINQEDQTIAQQVGEKLELIAEAVDQGSARYKKGGRLIYIGAGTSGRLGLLDAVELVPTYGISPDRAIGLIAGGNQAFVRAVEGAEDSKELAVEDLKAISLSKEDVVIGLAASGRTPYVIGGLEYANDIGALTIAISCNPQSQIGQIAIIPIDVPVGPEVVTGSTRMKAGTAQKMILNMISTGIMIKLGYVYQNLMINVQTTNEKLVDRGIRIICEATGSSRQKAAETMKLTNNEVNTAIVMIEKKLDVDQARTLIKDNEGALAKIID
ncbi:N-acetylmuramic acid 6-phosphate etherase [Enterococcus asini ATCC 700915]|uniref:N-acetylmuramic acid 6-phosphate etherase n=1 Tax=Enterococcus asini ATCC 700915 TaxID=1158606 RepID=R2Q1A2_9ENTE|nr:N-acetylmuramic acid 6-phosphate etherase [Enterococcus asini]EOH90342.1 N-acetylmuramic acid 6-phosphate etherase [Enterococcus asini ATCC 700915]EOT57026.1 N-acetylmuramic acid 6-phosphate etherase [Enterococcus asini ATCC 700915]OJG12410.1 N-acetylmuramic acid 6-phosphate etherase [Enterococcus asini]